MFYQNRIKVNPIDLPLMSWKGVQCAMVKIPFDIDTQGIKADIVLIATAANEPQEGYVAWASPCILDPNSNRPIAGQVVLFLKQELQLSLHQDQRLRFHRLLQSGAPRDLPRVGFLPTPL